MDKIVVIGGGGHAKVVISILKKIAKYKLSGYVDNQDRGKILNVDYLGNDDILGELFNKSRVKYAVLGLGSIESSIKRREIYQKMANFDFEFPPIVSPEAIINEGVILGKGTVVMDGAVAQSGTIIGKFAIINTNSSVDHDCEIGDFVHIAPGVTLSRGVRIGSNSFVGAGTTIIQNRKIAENCMIGAGSVVVRDCLESGKYFGVPAKKIES